jgi:DNA-binding protein H-NS
MPKVTQQPDPNRVQTRSKNANAHPGRAVMEALAVRRKPEDIEIEKQVKKERRKARAKKKADAQMAVLDIADFENNMAVDNIREETSFPRRQLEPEGKGLVS